MSVVIAGPRGTATTASSESAGAVPPVAVATTTAWPRAMPFRTQPGESEATDGFRLTNVTVASGIVLPLPSLPAASRFGRPPTAVTRGLGTMTNEAGPRNVAPNSRRADILTTQVVPPKQS